jgi:hypothetical protein
MEGLFYRWRESVEQNGAEKSERAPEYAHFSHRFGVNHIRAISSLTNPDRILAINTHIG